MITYKCDPYQKKCKLLQIATKKEKTVDIIFSFKKGGKKKITMRSKLVDLRCLIIITKFHNLVN